MALTERSNIPETTHFRDYVKELPHQWIFDNLISDADRSRRILSSAMVKEAVAKFVTKTSLTKRFEALPPELRLKCAQVYLMGKNGLPVTEPAAYFKEPLLMSLLVFAAQNGSDTASVRLFGFDEFEPVLRPLMAGALAEAAAAAECAAGPPACPWRPLNDVAAICSLALHRQLKRNTHGGLSRSTITALKCLVHDPTMTGKSVPEDTDSGHPAGFLIGFCLNEALIIDAGPEYLLNRQKFAAWLEKGMGERLQKLAGYAAEFSGCFGLELAREMLRRSEGRWLTVNPLLPEGGRQALVRALHVLECLGCLSMGSGSSSGGPRFTANRFIDGGVDELYAKEPKRDTVIMSDFTVVIPQEVSPAELFDFSNVGTLTAFDKVYKGQITKESVSNALSAGVDPERLREWLRVRRGSANVVKTADEWIREFSRLFVKSGSVLISSNEKVTRQIASLEPLRKHLTEVSAHTVFAVRPGSEQKVLDILAKLGFDTREPGGQAEPVTRDEPAEEFLPKEKNWLPLTDFSSAVNPPPPPMKRTKYGVGLKTLPINEMIHVVDYAILTNQALSIDYAGSTQIKQDIYTVTPISIDKGMDAAVEAEIPRVRGRKQFLLCKINRIGVVTQ
ncbi:MAG: helicase-associated domain-containing protein [Chitinispirillales bacterium]|jgi:hypothetical protein|nr:helicase-associated domain-containing protein [Chitinispirillales bacterium]